MRFRRRRLWLWIQAIVLFIMFPTISSLPEVIKIGGLFETTDEQQSLAFRYAIDMINTDRSILQRSKLSAQVTKNLAPDDSFRALKTACDYMEEGVAAIFSPPSPSTTAILQASTDALQIPLFHTHHDIRRSNHNFTINLYPESRTLATAYLDFILKQEWKSFAIIYEDNEALIRLQELLKVPSVNNVKITLRHAKTEDYKELMKELYWLKENNIVVDLPLYKVNQLFKDAERVKMLTEYQNYFLTSLDVNTIKWDTSVTAKANISALRLVDPQNPLVKRVVSDWIFSENRQGRMVTSQQPILTEAALMYDAVVVLARALAELDKGQRIDLKSLYCHGSTPWHQGGSIVKYIRMITNNGLTGLIKFDSNGHRTDVDLDIIKLTRNAVPVKIGSWDSKNRIKIDESGAVSSTDVLDKLRNTTLRITTADAKPFLMLKEPKDKYEGNDRFKGYVVDLVEKLAAKYGFKYIINIAKDKGYGTLTNGVWDGMVGELLKREADIAVADLTITSERESAVDFTLPFMNLGISILFKKSEKSNPPLFSFLKPLSLEVWFLMLTAFLGVSLFLYILARLSPYEWVNPHPCDLENEEVENQFNLLNSFWFAIGSLMQQGSDILPRAISTRIIASSWWFFTLIMISSYTANLAAFLTAMRMTSPIQSADDLAKQTSITYGCYLRGSTKQFFKNSTYPMYKRMYAFMESHRPTVFTESNTEGIERVRMGNYAYLMESAAIEYEVERNCDLMKIGGELDTKGYGIATRPGSPYKSVLSSGILQMLESGELMLLKEKWWKVKPEDKCPVDAKQTAEMDIANVGGVFVVLVMGMVLGIIVVLIEYVWKAKKKLNRDPISVMLWRDLKHIMTCQGSTRPLPEEPDEPSVEKVPMVTIRNLNQESEKYS